MRNRTLPSIAFALFTLIAIACNGAQSPVAAPAAKPAPIPREKFKEMVVGRTVAEVLTLLGKPEMTNQYDDGTQMWTYWDRTRDTITDKVDGTVFLKFNAEGKCVSTKN